MDISVRKALEYRNSYFEGVVKCTQEESLRRVLEKVVLAEVHRIVVVDSGDHVIGMISLSDILSFLTITKPGAALARSSSCEVPSLMAGPSTTATLVEESEDNCDTDEEEEEEDDEEEEEFKDTNQEVFKSDDLQNSILGHGGAAISGAAISGAAISGTAISGAAVSGTAISGGGSGIREVVTEASGHRITVEPVAMDTGHNSNHFNNNNNNNVQIPVLTSDTSRE